MVNPETKILQTVEEYYTNNVKTNPECNSKSVGWSTVDSQYLRFKKLNTVISDTNTKITVNDYGCGYAEHLSSFKKLNGINVTYYNGYDISNEMLSSAVTNLSTLNSIDPNFPLQFLIDLSEYMGFHPLYEKDGTYFNLEIGEFTNSDKLLNYYINQENVHYFKALLNKQKIITKLLTSLSIFYKKNLIYKKYYLITQIN